MMRRNIVLSCIVIPLILLSTYKVMAQPPSPPCRFYGYVQGVGGKPAKDGLNVTAVISGTTLNWTTETKNGTYGWPVKGSSAFMIPSDDPETPEKDGGVTGDSIEFYVHGIKIDQTATFESGGAKELDLSISETVDNQNGQSESTPNPYLFYAILIVIVIGTGLVAVFWTHRKGYRIKVSKKPK